MRFNTESVLQSTRNLLIAGLDDGEPEINMLRRLPLLSVPSLSLRRECSRQLQSPASGALAAGTIYIYIKPLGPGEAIGLWSQHKTPKSPAVQASADCLGA